MVQEAGRGCLPRHNPQHGSLRTQGERICHTEWQDSHILKSKRSITCGQRLAPSGREGETQVAAGLPTPLKDTEPLSRAVTAPPPGSGPPCTPATPASLNPPGSCGKLPSHRLPEDSWGTPSEGCWSRKVRIQRKDPAQLPHLPTWGFLSGQQLRGGSLRAASLTSPSCPQRAWVPVGPPAARALPVCT